MNARPNPFLLAWAYALILFIGHTISTGKIEEYQEAGEFFSIAFSDVALHIVAFGLFAWLLCFGYKMHKKSRLPYTRILFIAVAFGILMELWQKLLPYRVCKIKDMAFNLMGILFAMFLFYMIKGRKISISQ